MLRHVLLSLLVGLAPVQACVAEESAVAVGDRFYAELLATRSLPLDNLGGGIVWGISYQLDALVDFYEATGDTKYLEAFVETADAMFAARADRTGEVDYKGRITRGWLTNHHYTTGGPVTLDDAGGRPALAIETIAHDSNNKTTIEVTAGGTSGTFTLIVQSNKYPDKPVRQVYESLTSAGAEAAINPAPGERGLVSVRRLGDGVPAPRAAFTPETLRTTLHGHHTGRILNGVARFCALMREPGAPAAFQAKAREYLQAAEESMAEHDASFIEAGDAGYTIFEKGAPIWADGLPEPHNTLAASGSVYVHLYRATGKPVYRDRAERLARLIKRHHVLREDGTYQFHYWWGILETGWQPEDDVSVHTPAWIGSIDIENISHFQLTLNFMIDCYRAGLVFTAEDLRPWVASFHQRIHKPGEPAGELSFLVDGDQEGQAPLTANDFISGFIKLGTEFDPTIVDACARILRTHFAQSSSPSRLSSWGALAIAEARRATENSPIQQGEAQP